MSDEKKDVTDESAEDDNKPEESAPEETSEETSDAAEAVASDSDAASDSDEADESDESDSDASEESDVESDSDAAEESDVSDESDVSEPSAPEEESSSADDDEEAAHGGHGHDDHHGHGDHGHGDPSVLGVAAFFDHPDHLVYAASEARDAAFAEFDAYSPFPIHGMDDAMGLGRSWIPWVTFLAGATGFTLATALEFGIMAYDWPMVFGGKPFAAWPSFVPVMFELTVLLAGCTTALVMFIAAGCFRKPMIIDPEITNDRFVLWISASDEKFDRDGVIEFMKGLNPMEIRTVRKDAE